MPPPDVASELLQLYDLRDRLDLTAAAIRQSRTWLLASSSLTLGSLGLGIAISELWILFALWPSYFVWDSATKLRVRLKEQRVLAEALATFDGNEKNA
jgi:hypothetical protein